MMPYVLPFTKHILVFLYYAFAMWYYIFQFGAAGLNQAKLAEIWLEVSLSTGLVEQNEKNVLWSGGPIGISDEMRGQIWF